MLKTRDVLLLGLLVVGLRLLTVGDIGGASGGGDDLLEDRRRQRSKVRMPRTPNQRGGGGGGHSGASNDKLEASVKKSQDGGETSSARRGKRNRRVDPYKDIVQVEVMEEDVEAQALVNPVSLGGEEGLAQGVAEEEAEEAASWLAEQRDLRWRAILRPGMEFLVSKQSIQSGGTGGGHKPMVTFAFKDHKGGVRKLDWEADFTEAAQLPDYDWRWTSSVDLRSSGLKQRHSSCALVGNSGVMRNSKMGDEIDAHEAVLRINYAPTKGFERDVGAKTTYDLLNKENCMKLTKGEHHWRRPKSTVFLFESHSRIIRAQVYAKFFARAVVRSGEERALVLQPALMTASRSVYLMIKAEAEEEINALRLEWGATGQLNMTKLHRMSTYMANAVRRAGPMRHGSHKFEFNGKPMSGMAALFLCIQMCERTTMYGFNAFLDKRKQRYHYFDDREGMTEVHSFDLAMEVFRRIGEAYPVTVREMGREP